ncbi:MAG: hypothetical protein ACJAVI_002000 [Candidatus Azotimanducaceae bacterium]|jgi:hypothetical protein
MPDRILNPVPKVWLRLRDASQAESTLRPLALRLLSTKRPFFVAILARNPCVRLRLMTLG